MVESPRGGFALTSLLFVSGALALVYEVIWQRQFALIFGSAAPATAAVLAAYFAGLGLGSVTLGRWASRWRRPLRVYAWLEVLIGAGALLVTPMLAGLETLYRALFAPDGEAGGPLLAVRLAIAFGATLLPTFCMGGTIPVLSEWVDRGRDRLGITAGRLYVANTAGAAVGAVSVPFVLLPTLGLAATIISAAAANFALAGIAWRMEAAMRSDDDDAGSPKTRAVRSASGGRGGAILAWAAFSGVVTFALQVLWNRAFAQVHENSMHSFAVIVALVILALSCGGQLARVALRRGIEPRTLLGGAWVGAGVMIIGGPWFFYALSNGLAYQPRGDSWIAQLAGLAGVGAAICFVPTVLLGMAVPALMEETGRSAPHGAGQALGRLFACNVAGSVGGALLAGFVLPAALGMWGGLVVLGGATLALGAGAMTAGVKRWAIFAVAVLLVGLGLRAELPRVRLATSSGETLVALREGAHGIVAVVERENSRRLKLNNHYALGGTAATGDERMQAHLPLLLHPAPRSVAFLGVGTGVTAGGATFHPVDRLVLAELVPEVIEAARIHFSDANAGVIEARQTRVVMDDARHLLAGTEERFDVIVGDLVVPWRAGEGALFTREQFEAARAALAPGGLFCQWLPLFQLSEEETHMLVRTFLSVFPNAQVWRGDFSPTEPAIALMGGRDVAALDAVTVQRRLAEMRRDPANTHLSAAGVLWMHYVGQVRGEHLPPKDERLNTENHPWVELLGPRLHGGRGEALFVGRKLEPWLARIRASSGGELEKLPRVERDAVAAGAAMAELVLGVAENDRAGATRAHEALQRLLPAETFRQLFP